MGIRRCPQPLLLDDKHQQGLSVFPEWLSPKHGLAFKDDFLAKPSVFDSAVLLHTAGTGGIQTA
jgi:hypothetical protein